MTITRSGWTSHGHWYGPDTPTRPWPRARFRCGGPGRCGQCSAQAEPPRPRPDARGADTPYVIPAGDWKPGQEIARTVGGWVLATLAELDAQQEPGGVYWHPGPLTSLPGLSPARPIVVRDEVPQTGHHAPLGSGEATGA
jgi:hypothetical protein